MRAKPRISRRSDGRWTVTRPALGFRPTDDETVHESWRDAVNSLIDASDHYAGGGWFERVHQRTDAVAAIPPWTPLDYARASPGTPGNDGAPTWGSNR